MTFKRAEYLTVAFVPTDNSGITGAGKYLIFPEEHRENRILMTLIC
jgi:hypothetical protein